MFKKKIKMFLLIIISLTLTGCWDYIGIDELTIVSGIALDKDNNNGRYNLTFEVIDIPNSSKDFGIKTSLIESRGKTIFDAIRNAKKKAENKLYFSATSLVVISNQIAKEDGVKSVIDMFLRDAEFRETLTFSISAAETAKELLDVNPLAANILSYEVRQIIKEDNLVTSSTNYLEMCKLFNTLESEGNSLAVPYIIKTSNDGDLSLEVDGMAVFKNDKMIGKIGPNESKFYLFITGEIMGGIIPLKVDDNSSTSNVSLEIKKNFSSTNYKYDGKKLKIIINTHTDVFLAEANNLSYPLDKKVISQIGKQASEEIENNIKNLIKSAKEEFRTDIFSFGNMVYRSDPKLWKELEKNWDKVYLDAEIEVKSRVHILNSAFIK